MELEIIISFIAVILVPMVGHLYTITHRNTNELRKHETHVAENYATKIEVEKLGDRIERQMTQGFENLKQLLTRNKDAA
jgi:hypothetical protein